jgi:hypothetical protein
MLQLCRLKDKIKEEQIKSFIERAKKPREEVPVCLLEDQLPSRLVTDIRPTDLRRYNALVLYSIKYCDTFTDLEIVNSTRSHLSAANRWKSPGIEGLRSLENHLSRIEHKM